jgi:hypothetical protein
MALCNKSVSLNRRKDNLVFSTLGIAIRKDKAIFIVLALFWVVVVLLLDKMSKAIVLLRALKKMIVDVVVLI